MSDKETQLKELGLWVSDVLKEAEISSEILSSIPQEFVIQYQVIPYKEENGYLILLSSVSNIKNKKLVNFFEEITGKKIKMLFTSLDNIQDGLIKFFGITDFTETAEPIQYTDPEDSEFTDDAETESQEYTEDNALIKLVNSVFTMALGLKVSDIHFKPLDKGLEISYRINGNMLDVTEKFPQIKNRKFASRVMNRLKAMCEPKLKTTDNMTQSGAIAFLYQARVVDCRVSIIPTIRGESIAIRLLDKDKTPLKLSSLGFSEDEVKNIKKVIKHPSGLFVVTGPTNSGKSTTLYAALGNFDPQKWKIITAEDPVEYKNQFFVQCQIRYSDIEKLNLTFAKLLKEYLRQDPDILLIGEIRDEETAEIAIQASLTGHKVFSTLHNKDVISTINRLCNMGIDRNILLGELSFIVSQRLLSIICEECKEKYFPTDEELLSFNEEKQLTIKEGDIYKGKGCPKCKQSGYSGITAIGEFLFLNNYVRDFLTHDHSRKEIDKFLRDEIGFKSMWDKAFSLMMQGKVTIEDVIENIPRDE